MSDLYLLNYNNYYNRIVKKEDTLDAYKNPDGASPTVLQNINFVPNDGVDTTQVVNIHDSITPDYLIVVENGEIKSRWFIIESTRERSGQYKLTLHRDLVVDYYDSILNAPCFIEKATLPSNNDLIFNKEDISVNQIKQSELLLKDETKSPWICIYAASKKSDGSGTSFNLEIPDDSQKLDIALTYSSEEEFRNSPLYVKGIEGNITGKATLDYVRSQMQYYAGIGNNQVYKFLSYKNSSSNSRTYLGKVGVGTSYGPVMDVSTLPSLLNLSSEWDNLEYAATSYIPDFDDTLYNEAIELNNKIIRVAQSEGSYKYYKVQISLSTNKTYNQNIKNDGSNLWTIYNNMVTPQVKKINVFEEGSVSAVFSIQSATVVFNDITSSISNITLNIPADRQHLIDGPYDIFVMPYSDDTVVINNIPSNKQLSLTIARELIASYAGGGQIYDAQILPYCPINADLITETNGKVYLTINNDKQITYIKGKNSTNVGCILHTTFSSFSKIIKLENPIVIQDYKIENECDMYRLCSPNYNGIFEFSAAKNDGVAFFNLQCTYKPHTPYIKLYPDWGRLYGDGFSQDESDARGLICGGDFSLPMTTSAWATYELQNKNYNLQFSRQIENLETNYKYQRAEEYASGAVGVLGGAGAGMMLGSVGGPAGIAIGGALGGLASLLGAGADRHISEQRHAEALDYTKDQFGYQLGNIKAMPMSLSKVTAYNIDNKYFPFLEYYTCSDVEREAVKNKIKYNGMTVMAIGTISQYIREEKSYIKGKIIRMEDIKDDTHVIIAISDEIYKGVYI